jgi:glucosamine-phosphate N-acetyltransferase
MINSIKIRKAEFKDFETIIILLQDISHFIPEDDHNLIWKNFDSQHNLTALVAVSIEGNYEKVIGFASILFEIKVRGGIMGHIEDVVVDVNYRNLGVGRFLINELINVAKIKKCYKISLECRENKIQFYKHVGFDNTGYSMNYFLK